MDAMDQFKEWYEEWDKVGKKFEPKKKAVKPTKTSFFGMRELDPDEVKSDKQQMREWSDLFEKSYGLRDDFEEPARNKGKTEETPGDSVPTERIVKSYDADDDDEPDLTGLDKINQHGFGKELADKPGKDVKFYANPVHFASIGDDQELRVAGAERISELAKLKSLVYSIESELLRADTLGEPTVQLEQKLKSLRKTCHKLSNLLSPDPKTDVI